MWPQESVSRIYQLQLSNARCVRGNAAPSMAPDQEGSAEVQWHLTHLELGFLATLPVENKAKIKGINEMGPWATKLIARKSKTGGKKTVETKI